MTTEERNQAFAKFIDFLDSNPMNTSHRITEDVADLDINEDNLPKLEPMAQLMDYHKDITKTIENTYHKVSDIMIHMKQLKNRKKNVQTTIDCMTAIVQVKKLSYGLGLQPKQIYHNLQTYYSIKSKVYFVDKFIQRIENQIIQIQKEYQSTFDSEMAKNNSNNIVELSKVLQLIRTHTHNSSKPDTFQQISQFCLSNAKKEFKKIEEELFTIPIVGNNQSNYQFFDMAKTAMKIIVTLSNNSKNNVIKVSGEEGFIQILAKLFELSANGIILQLLMRLKKYFQIDKIILNQAKFTIKQKELKRLQPYLKQFIAIWNQLQRLRIYLLSQINQTCPKKIEFKMNLQKTVNNTHFVEINSSVIQFIQAVTRFKFDKLLKNSVFVNSICIFDTEFLNEINSKNIIHNSHVQDFLQQTMNKVSEGIEMALQTLNTLIISATINFINHSLIYEDVFFAFNELFSRCFSKMPSNDSKVQNAVILVLNSLTAFPRALRTLLHFNLPAEIPQTRIRVELQEIVNNNEQRSFKVLQSLIGKIVSAEWFHYQLTKEYQKILDKWIGLQNECSNMFVQSISKVHATIILQTQFTKKYTETSAAAFQKQIRSIISHYERYSHSILPNFKKILDYIEVLLLEGEEDYIKLVTRFQGVYKQTQLKRIWNLRT